MAHKGKEGRHGGDSSKMCLDHQRMEKGSGRYLSRAVRNTHKLSSGYAAILQVLASKDALRKQYSSCIC